VSRHGRIEFLVLDLHLPGLSGLELLARWRADAAWTDPPVVMTTSDPGDAVVLDAVATGAVDGPTPSGGATPTGSTGEPHCCGMSRPRALGTATRVGTLARP
jgi:CheY-like chemotaxis protein